MKKLTVAVHDGMFHADDVFAIAILKKIYPNLKVIRTRDEKILESVDMRVDIGRKYNFKTGDFDHHQDSSPLRDNSIPYASCGLIWKHFGRKLVNSDEAFERIDKKIIEFIDAGDNGVNYSNKKVSIYSIGEVIDDLNPTWDEKGLVSKGFNKAVKLAAEILDRKIERANSAHNGTRLVEKALKNAEGSFVVLPHAGLPNDLIKKDEKMMFSIFPTEKGEWIASGVAVEEGSYERRRYFPVEWAGLEDDDLEKVSGIKGAKFCHKARFLISAKTKEAAIKMVRKALEK